MTNHWVDMKNANLISVMGSNEAEAHPVGFRWAMEAKIYNNAKMTNLGMLLQNLPGYMTLPSKQKTDLESYLAANTPQVLRATAISTRALTS
ncbi:MAG: hypothetical protein G5663_06365 [Serratia symbiotica]|nr:hypothetical protein [Serratia symbiotica]